VSQFSRIELFDDMWDKTHHASPHSENRKYRFLAMPAQPWFFKIQIMQKKEKRILRQGLKMMLLGFKNCLVTNPEENILFEPQWGR